MGSYLVVGSGISGATAALSLAQLGHSVVVVERAPRAGGKVLDYCCKAARTCTRCGVCVALGELDRSFHHAGVATWVSAEVLEASVGSTGIRATVRRRFPSIALTACVSCDRCARACPAGCISRVARGDLVQYSIEHARCVLHLGGRCTACADACPVGAIDASRPSADVKLAVDAVLVASGHEPYPAQRKVRLGYGRIPNVLSGADMERLLQGKTTLWPEARSVAFIQCVGSRDARIGRPYCSSACCAYALRMAARLKDRSPGISVTIYAIDLQNFDKTFSVFRKEQLDGAVRILRGVPSEVEMTGTGRLRVVIPAGDGDGGARAEEHDLIVLSVGMGPAAGAAGLAGLFGLRQDEWGFLRSTSDVVFTCGTCHEPQGIDDSIAHARAVALEMHRAVEHLK